MKILFKLIYIILIVMNLINTNLMLYNVNLIIIYGINYRLYNK
jgi:hypothetical protein